MIDLLLMLIVTGVLVIAIGVDIAVLVAWVVRRRWR